ncbi:GNAT family N-acetyltransferase [Streptomyces sp. NBC_00094]|uniref:GNAT family N-acetyltransferase n=1 Tax=Streptomyces sp. NBC_00094 TaxID=2903620 RepID=UPI00224EED1D|nr:GNAT family N-acetyltransferase [Streptomyces sp. NBC_00094]MCX5390299.1 GNAT family N-acetyltransferase [Streptomyces sp. NBC_00094]
MTTQVTFRQADEQDLDLLVGLFDGLAHWMVRNGIDQWKPGAKSAEHFRGRIADGEVWLALDGGRAFGAYELWWEDEQAWGPQPPVAGYVHRLMTDREAAPAGAGRVLLAHAEERIAARGRAVARLDSMTNNPRLRTYYEAAGYLAVGEEPGKLAADGTRYGVTLWEKALTRP